MKTHYGLVLACMLLTGCTINMPNANISGQGTANVAIAASPPTVAAPAVVPPGTEAAPQPAPSLPAPSPTPSPIASGECELGAPAEGTDVGRGIHGRYSNITLPKGYASAYLSEAEITASIAQLEAKDQNFSCFKKFFSSAWIIYLDLKNGAGGELVGAEDCEKSSPAATPTVGSEKHGRYAGQNLPNGWDNLDSEEKVTSSIRLFEAKQGEQFACFLKFYGGAWVTFQKIKDLPPVLAPVPVATTAPAVSGRIENKAFSIKFSRSTWANIEPSIADIGNGVLAHLGSQISGRQYSLVVWRVASDLTLSELVDAASKTSDKYWLGTGISIDGEVGLGIISIRGDEYRNTTFIEHDGVTYEIAVVAPTSIKGSDETVILNDVNAVLASWKWE